MILISSSGTPASTRTIDDFRVTRSVTEEGKPLCFESQNEKALKPPITNHAILLSHLMLNRPSIMVIPSIKTTSITGTRRPQWLLQDGGLDQPSDLHETAQEYRNVGHSSPRGRRRQWWVCQIGAAEAVGIGRLAGDCPPRHRPRKAVVIPLLQGGAGVGWGGGSGPAASGEEGATLRRNETCRLQPSAGYRTCLRFLPSLFAGFQLIVWLIREKEVLG